MAQVKLEIRIDEEDVWELEAAVGWALETARLWSKKRTRQRLKRVREALGQATAHLQVQTMLDRQKPVPAELEQARDRIIALEMEVAQYKAFEERRARADAAPVDPAPAPAPFTRKRSVLGCRVCGYRINVPAEDVEGVLADGHSHANSVGCDGRGPFYVVKEEAIDAFDGIEMDVVRQKECTCSPQKERGFAANHTSSECPYYDIPF